MRTMPGLGVKNCYISTWRKDRAGNNQQASNCRKGTPNLITALMGRLDNRIQGKMNKIIVLNEIQMKLNPNINLAETLNKASTKYFTIS